MLWLGQNSFRVVELLLAAAELGAMFCPANWRQSPEELAFVIDDLDADGRRLAGRRDRRRRAGRPGARRLRRPGGSATTPSADDPDGYEAFLGRPGVPTRRAGRTATSTRPPSVLLIYTAAFAGRPNAAMLSHTACIAQGIVYGALTGTTADDVYLNSGPMFHLGTLMHTLATFVAGGTNVFVPRVDAELLCRTIEAERCTGAFLVGPMFEQILEVNAGGALRPLEPAQRARPRRVGRDGQPRHQPHGPRTPAATARPRPSG